MSRNNDGSDGGRRSAAEEVAAQRAVREQSEILDVRNAVLGQETVGNRQITAEEANDLKRGAGREGLDAAAVMDFSRTLADVAAGTEDPDLTHEEEKDQEARVARETAIAEEVDPGADEPDPEEDGQGRNKGKASRKFLESDKKTSGMGGGDGPADAGGGPVAAAPSPRADTVDGLPVVSVVPRKRRNAVDLDAILVAGRDAGVLPPWMRDRADETIQRLPTRHFTRLFHALNIAGGLVPRAYVLKALLAHRPPTALVPFAQRLAGAGRDGVVEAAPGPDAPDEPPDDSGIAHLRLFWDPLATLGVDEDWARSLEEESGEDPWVVPKWLRGVPRPPLDLCIVALELALQGVLDDEEETTAGASDALVRAFEGEGEAHPALQRWLLSLSARAEDRSGLLAAREVMMRARGEMSRPWTAPRDRQVWR